MLLLAIVFIGWVRMNNIQAVNRESLRYAAIEKAAGMLDAIEAKKQMKDGMYLRINDNGSVSPLSGPSAANTVHPLFDDRIPIGYQLRVSKGDTSNPGLSTWGSASGSASLWLVCDLFDFHGERQAEEAPFTSLNVFLKN